MRVLFDTNVVLDLLLARAPHDADARILFSHVENETIQGILCATTLTTIHYLATKSLDQAIATGAVRSLLRLFEVASVNQAVIEGALQSGFQDFEDGVLHESARLAQAQAIVTRNVQDFGPATLPIYTPTELTALLAIKEKSQDQDDPTL